MPSPTADPKAGPSRRPNLLVVMGDQLRRCSTGFGGESLVRTPTLDAFAAESVDFTSAVSNTPLCSPFRGSLLTGRYAHCHGVIANDLRLPNDAVTFGEVLKREGYNTGYVGKWHLSGPQQGQYEPPGPGRHGFDYWSAYEFNHDHNRTIYYEDAAEPSGAIIASYAGYSGFNPGWEYRGIRTKRYTYARSLVQLQRGYTGWQPGDSCRREQERFLFDNLADPYQLENLADSRKHSEAKAELEAQLAAYLRETNDRFLPAPEYAALCGLSRDASP